MCTKDEERLGQKGLAYLEENAITARVMRQLLSNGVTRFIALLEYLRPSLPEIGGERQLLNEIREILQVLEDYRLVEIRRPNGDDFAALDWHAFPSRFALMNSSKIRRIADRARGATVGAE